MWIVVTLLFQCLLQCVLSPRVATASYTPQHVGRKISPKVFIFGMVSGACLLTIRTYLYFCSLRLRGMLGSTSPNLTYSQRISPFQAFLHYSHRHTVRETSLFAPLSRVKPRLTLQSRSPLSFTPHCSTFDKLTFSSLVSLE